MFLAIQRPRLITAAVPSNCMNTHLVPCWHSRRKRTDKSEEIKKNGSWEGPLGRQPITDDSIRLCVVSFTIRRQNSHKTVYKSTKDTLLKTWRKEEEPFLDSEKFSWVICPLQRRRSRQAHFTQPQESLWINSMGRQFELTCVWAEKERPDSDIKIMM